MGSISPDTYEIPKTFKAAVYDDPGKISIKIKELETPEPGPGEALIRLTHSGVCHSDLSVMTNGWKTLPFPTPEGQIGGHEGVGIVQKLGPGNENSPVKIGARVGVKWAVAACGACPQCRTGYDGHCSTVHKFSGYFTPGTFAEYVVSEANYVTPIPDNLDGADAAPMLCAGLTSYSALRKCNAKSGEWVVISGAGGGLGHLAIQIAARGMAYRVIGIDHGSKEGLVKECGAEHFVDLTKFDDQTIVEEIKRLTGGAGAAAVIVCAGVNAAYGQALPMLQFGGTMVCVGMPDGELKPISSAFPMNLSTSHTRIVGSSIGSRQEAVETLALAARGLVKTHHRLAKLDALEQSFQEMAAGKLEGRVVLDLRDVGVQAVETEERVDLPVNLDNATDEKLTQVLSEQVVVC